jgi:hypothetical protein
LPTQTNPSKKTKPTAPLPLISAGPWFKDWVHRRGPLSTFLFSAPSSFAREIRAKRISPGRHPSFAIGQRPFLSPIF